MRLKSITINGFRAHKDAFVLLDDYTILIGSNGSGKSSILYALDWFFNGGEISDEDLHTRPEDTEPSVSKMSVEVTFEALNDRDKRILGEYGRVPEPKFRRTYDAETGSTKFIGNTMQGPGFERVRSIKAIGEKRAGYIELQSELDGLPTLAKLAKSDEIASALAMWEGDPVNISQLTTVDDVDATHMFGFNGVNVLRDCFQLVLIPAGNNLASDTGALGKGTALSNLLGAFVSDAGTVAREEWLLKNQSSFEELETEISDAVVLRTESASTSVNEALAQFIPGAEIKFHPAISSVPPRIDTTLTTIVTVDGRASDVGRHGHGVQRAVLMSILQAMARGSDPNPTDQQADGDEESFGPSVLLCVEEPEIFQHPARARLFADTLTSISNQANKQVLVASHSPYFIKPEQFANLRRVALVESGTAIDQSNTQRVADSLGHPDHSKVSKEVQRWFPGSFSEGFFSDAVVLVEGQTDQVVIECLYTKMRDTLSSRSISILQAGSKTGFPMGSEILRSTGVPVYLIFDADFKVEYSGVDPLTMDAALREKFDSHFDATSKALSSVKCFGTESAQNQFSFGDETYAGDTFGAFQLDLESELALWPSFVSAIDAQGGRLGQKFANKYRAAVNDAKLDDLPDSLETLIRKIDAFATKAGNEFTRP